MPKISPDTPPRKRRVSFTVDDDTYELLGKAAKKANQSLSAFAREAALRQLRERGYLFG